MKNESLKKLIGKTITDIQENIAEAIWSDSQSYYLTLITCSDGTFFYSSSCPDYCHGDDHFHAQAPIVWDADPVTKLPKGDFFDNPNFECELVFKKGKK